MPSCLCGLLELTIVNEMLSFVLQFGQTVTLKLILFFFLFVFQIRKVSLLDPAPLPVCPESYLLLAVIFFPSLWIKCERTPLALVM